MGFSDDIDKFVKKEKDRFEKKVAEHDALAKTMLVEILGADLNAITSITFDLEKGKFKDVEAPEYVKEKLRKADLIIE